MEAINQNEVNLFAGQLPTLQEIAKLSDLVNSSESEKNSFSGKLQENLGQKSKAAMAANGIGLCLIGKYDDAIETLGKAQDCVQKFFYLGLAFRKKTDLASAIENFDKSLAAGADKLCVALQKSVAYKYAGDLKAAAKELKGCSNFANVSADYHYHLGRLSEAEGLYEQATKDYKKALELEPDNQRALFHLAYRCDMEGDEQAAIEYYKEMVSTNPVYVHALLNLAVLYEDSEKFDHALKCVNKVLKFHPNHQRAILFKKDIQSSKTMFYDEEKESKKTKTNKILETPISDFELSVRSRNCLRKMKINTIGDLLNITESELLSYKNFGETSLREIKAILDSKDFRLGMAVEESCDFALASAPDAIEENPENAALLGKPVEDLQLSVRARKCLEKLNLRTIGEVVKRTEAELLGCKNFGVTSLNEIKKSLSNFGISLRNLDN